MAFLPLSRGSSSPPGRLCPGLAPWVDVCGRSEGQLGRLATSGPSLWGEGSWNCVSPESELGTGPEAGVLPDSGGAMVTVVLEPSRPIPWGRYQGGGFGVHCSCNPLPQEVSPALGLLSCPGEAVLFDRHLKPLRALGAGAQDLLVPFVPWPHRPRHAGP